LTHLVVLMGLPGAGKTLLADAIAAQMHWPVISRDVFPRGQFSAAEKAAATDAALAAVATQLSRGQSCILDGMTFADAAQR
jgi:adenylate kinase family enzyme